MKVRIFYFLVSGWMLLCSPLAHAATVPAAATNPVNPVQLLYRKMVSLTVKDLQKQLGRRLTLKEKILFWVAKKKARHELKKVTPGETGGAGQSSFVFGLVAVGLLVAGLFVPYVILGSIVSSILAIAIGTTAYKKDRNDSKAHMGKLIGWITLGVTLALILAAAIIIASWSWY